jgi:hypothetical protein
MRPLVILSTQVTTSGIAAALPRRVNIRDGEIEADERP